VRREQIIQDVLHAFPEWYRVEHWEGTQLFGPIRIQTRSRIFTFKVQIVVAFGFPDARAHPRARILEHDLGVELARRLTLMTMAGCACRCLRGTRFLTTR
jgi:hypothetical protein